MALPRCWVGGFPFVRIELQECGLVWQRCVPTEVQRLKWLTAAEFASAQSGQARENRTTRRQGQERRKSHRGREGAG
eukprot:COSAG05_NODE_12215_length_477_cov_0.997354_1_plen_76_part_10